MQLNTIGRGLNLYGNFGQNEIISFQISQSFDLFHLKRQVMHISVAKLGGSEPVLTLEIASDLSLKDLKAVIEAESDFGITADEMNLYYEGE